LSRATSYFTTPLLLNTVTANFNAITGQMTEMYQRKKTGRENKTNAVGEKEKLKSTSVLRLFQCVCAELGNAG